MRKLMIFGALAALAWAQGARAEDPQEAKAEAQEKVQKAEAKAREETHEAQADAQKKTAEAQQEAREEKAEAQEKVQKAETKAREGDTAPGTVTGAATGSQKKHPAFEGKDNFEVKGRIASVSASSITIRREELPAAKLRVDRNTKIELDGQHVSASQLKAGQDVKASFNLQDDKPMAVDIKAQKMNK